MNRKKLPIGIQTFATIRGDDYYYVDKTGYAMQVAEGRTCFLSRPRRFGKSLFLDTLAQMFAGNKALFEGLACYDVWDWDTVYPVVRLGFAEGLLTNQAALDERIVVQLERNAERLGLGPVPDYQIADRFIWLIQQAEKVHGQQVVVLVDEYDKPILDNLGDPGMAAQMRDGLRNVYSVLKGQEAHLRFVMLTGVSKFSKVSIFSGLNNLEDITLSPRYSAVCGYTEDDLDAVFGPELEGLDRQKVREWYNGYNWCGQAVYNPFDLLLLFRDQKFGYYWFESATPTFLVEMLTQRRTYLPQLADLEASETQLSTFDVGNMSTVALLFQTGYLTIDPALSDPPDMYRLKYPNMEVRKSLAAALLDYLRPTDQVAGTGPTALRRLLTEADFDNLRDYVSSMFSGIPTNWHTKNDLERFEGYYASVFYAYFAAAGLTVITEDASSTGRVDMTVRTATGIFVLEFKVVPPAKAGDAMAQIDKKRYADKYLTEGLPVYQIGVEFSPETRNIITFDVKQVA